ncbi:hypothetical protein FOQG_19606 [Fusarium oxysporum f. sp. raphani 54005]|uniref:Uncharacterized protein n=2 Tax=Fusarium oxysporum f. sp. raphani TaxID=96318 RepID=X0BYL1_FUSOX|nr:hypothetical protein FOQG_19606 [Fusarium oxysporum f. sp. raphani 54005]
MSSVPEDVDMTLDEPDVPEASQRISTPHVDGLDISQQGRPQQPHAEPHAEPPVEPHAEPQGIELEVPEPHRPVSPPIMDGYSMLQEQHKQREALELQQKQQQDALKLQQPQQQDALQLQQPRTQPQQEALKRKKEINKPGNDTTEIRKPDKDDEFPNKRKKVYDTHKKVYDTREKVDDTREPEIPQRPEACLEAPALEEEEEW